MPSSYRADYGTGHLIEELRRDPIASRNVLVHGVASMYEAGHVEAIDALKTMVVRLCQRIDELSAERIEALQKQPPIPIRLTGPRGEAVICWPEDAPTDRPAVEFRGPSPLADAYRHWVATQMALAPRKQEEAPIEPDPSWRDRPSLL